MHPQKQLVPLPEARQWSVAKYLIQRKYDGELATRHVGNAILLGESVTLKSGGFFTATDRAFLSAHGRFFAAFTVVRVGEIDYLSAPTRVRDTLLRSISILPPDVTIAETVTDVAAAFANGAEGACAHDWNAPWGAMLACKQGGIWNCKVIATGGTQSVEIVDAATGEPRGRVKLGGGKCDQVRVGSLIRVEGMGLTDAGKIREPRPCRQWLVQY